MDLEIKLVAALAIAGMALAGGGMALRVSAEARGA